MKLYAHDNSELMEVNAFSREANNLVIDGTIMGALPIRAAVKPAEIRRAIRMMDFRTKCFALSMLFRPSR